MNRLELSGKSRVREGQLDGLKNIAAEFIRQTKEKDTKTLRFDWFLSTDQTENEIREEYVDAQGFVEHKTHTAEVTERLFAQFATDHRVDFFGDPPPPLVEKVKQTPMGQTVKWFHFFQGLEPEPISYWSAAARARGKPVLELGAHMIVRAGQIDGFKRQAAEMLRLARDKDTRTLRYDWFLSSDGTACEVREAYFDAEALIQHNANIAEARDALFADFADNHFMTAYGEATKELLDLIKATHMEEHFKMFTLLVGIGEPKVAEAITAG